MDKIEPKEKEGASKLTYKTTWPAVRGTIKGVRHSNGPVSVVLKVIDGKVKDVIINGTPFILDVSHGSQSDREKGGGRNHG